MTALLGSAALLSGCAGEADPVGQAGDPSSTATIVPATNEPTAAAAACPKVPQEGFELTSSDLVTAAPAEGQVYGGVDHPVQWTFAEAQDLTPSVDLYYVDAAGDAIAMGGLFLTNIEGNTWGDSSDVFWSDAADRPGFAIVTLTNSASMADDGTLSADTDIAGVYCLTYHVSE